jgi:hypothetical protein
MKFATRNPFEPLVDDFLHPIPNSSVNAFGLDGTHSTVDGRVESTTHVYHQEPCKFDKLFLTVIIPDEESFDFPVIEWCDDDENVVKTDDSQHRSLYQSQNGNCIASRASVTDDCRRNVPCLMRCRSILADLAVLGTLGMEIPCSSSTSERTPTSYAAFGID